MKEKQTIAQPAAAYVAKGQGAQPAFSIFLLGLLALTMAAAVMRFFRVDTVPFGLHLDETYNALDAYGLTQKMPWYWPVFFTRNFGREPLHIYLGAVAQLLLGQTHLAVRIVPALASVALTPALAWLAWELAPYLAVRRRYHFALWSGAASLALLWAQMHARIFVRGGLFLLLEVLLLASFWRAWRSAKPTKWWLLAGFLAGLSIYTFLPARLLPGVFVLLAPLLILHDRARWRRQWRGIVLAILVAALTALPLLLHFLYHPQDFLMRTGQVSVFSGKVSVDPWEQVAGVLGMAFVRGDFNPRMNYPMRPVLDIFTTGPFLIGLAVVVWRFRRPGFFFLLSLAGVMSLSTLLSLGTPNFGRAVGMLPFFVLCIALGLERLAGWVEKIGRRAATAAVLFGYGLLLAGMLLTWQVYFVEWAQLPELFHWWDEGYTRLAYDIANREPDTRVYVSPQGVDHPTVRYLLLDRRTNPIHGFDGRVCVRVATDVPAHYYFVFDDWVRGLKLLQSYLPDSQTHNAIADPTGNVWAQRLDQPENGAVRFPEQIPFSVALADGIALQGYWLSQPALVPGQRLYTRFFWQVTAPPSQSYTVFSHLVQVDESGASTQLAGADRLPGDGSCSTTDWLPGEVVVDELQFVLPDSLPQPEGSQYYLEVGFYTLADGKRLDIPDNAEDRLLIGPLQLSQ